MDTERCFKCGAVIDEKKEQKKVDDSFVADAIRFRWLLKGNGSFMEQQCLCVYPTSEGDRDKARALIDIAMRKDREDGN